MLLYWSLHLLLSTGRSEVSWGSNVGHSTLTALLYIDIFSLLYHPQSYSIQLWGYSVWLLASLRPPLTSGAPCLQSHGRYRAESTLHPQAEAPLASVWQRYRIQTCISDPWCSQRDHYPALQWLHESETAGGSCCTSLQAWCELWLFLITVMNRCFIYLYLTKIIYLKYSKELKDLKSFFNNLHNFSSKKCNWQLLSCVFCCDLNIFGFSAADWTKLLTWRRNFGFEKIMMCNFLDKVINIENNQQINNGSNC